MLDPMKHPTHYRDLETPDSNIHVLVFNKTKMISVLAEIGVELAGINTINYETYAAVSAATWLYEDFP